MSRSNAFRRFSRDIMPVERQKPIIALSSTFEGDVFHPSPTYFAGSTVLAIEATFRKTDLKRCSASRPKSPHPKKVAVYVLSMGNTRFGSR